jgi:F-type H+-transporting ATPase subunit epsilon
MPQHWRVAGLSYLKYANICAEYVRRVLKEPERTRALSRAGYSMVKADWEGGKVVSRKTLESALLDDPPKTTAGSGDAMGKSS